MRFLSLLVVFILSCCIPCTDIVAQSIQQGRQAFKGGDGAGSSSIQTATPVTLTGESFSLSIYHGSSGHGSNAAQQGTPTTLSGQIVSQTLYQGGPSDGHAFAAKDTAVTLAGSTVSITLFQGGIADGAAAGETKVLTLDGGTLDLTLYKGGAGDGWAQATMPGEKALNGSSHTPTLFFGGAADGWAAATAKDETLDGSKQVLVLYNGGEADGFAAATLPEELALNGMKYKPTLFQGGSADGWAMAASKDQTLQGEVLQLSLYQGGQGDGWAIYTSKSQSLDGAQEDLVLFRGGNGAGYQSSIFVPETISPLPVELASFSAHRLHNEQVELRWTTASEQDNAGFEVWRSDNTTKAWQQVAFVEGAGNSAITRRYTFLDNNTHTGTSYYRLRQVDTDGTATFSKTVATPGADFSRRTAAAWPIPADDYLTVQAPDVAKPASLQLYSADARLLLQRQFTNKTELDLRHLPTGLYFLHVFQAGQPPSIIKVMKAP